MKIDEIYKGHYAVKLDFPDRSILSQILNMEYRYVWGLQHSEIRSKWSDYNGTLFGVFRENSIIQARNMTLEFLIESKSFFEIINSINQSIHLIQINTPPPSYLNFEKLKGKGKYDLLEKQLDYYLEIEIPGACDYAYLVSPDYELLRKSIKWVELNS